MFRPSVGGLLVLGPNVWTAPRSSSGLHDVPFGHATAGLGAGAGFYVEGRMFGYLGLEIDVIVEYDQLRSTIRNPRAGSSLTFTASWLEARIPILFELDFDTPRFRYALSLGPELVFTKALGTSVGGGGELPSTSEPDADFRARERIDVFVCTGFTLGIKLGRFVLPVGVRLSYNATLPESPSARLGGADPPWTLAAVQVLDIRFVTGLQYDF
jgi:hypothetical protein